MTFRELFQETCRRWRSLTPEMVVGAVPAVMPPHGHASGEDLPALGLIRPAPATALSADRLRAATRDARAMEHLQAVYKDIAHAALTVEDSADRAKLIGIEAAVHVVMAPIVERICARIELAVSESDLLLASTLRPPAP